MESVPFARLTPESAAHWECVGAVLLEACIPESGLSIIQEELKLVVLGFSGLKSYVVEPGAVAHFPDQSIKLASNNRGKRERTLGSCILTGIEHRLTITKTKEEVLYRVKRSNPR